MSGGTDGKAEDDAGSTASGELGETPDKSGASAKSRGFKFLACVREDHGKAIYSVAFAPRGDHQNYFATIGANRVSCHVRDACDSLLLTLQSVFKDRLKASSLCNEASRLKRFFWVFPCFVA